MNECFFKNQKFFLLTSTLLFFFYIFMLIEDFLRSYYLLDRACSWSVLITPSWRLHGFFLLITARSNCWNYRSEAQRERRECALVSTHLPPTLLVDSLLTRRCPCLKCHTWASVWSYHGHSCCAGVQFWKWKCIHRLHEGNHWSAFVPHNFVVWQV